MLTRAAYEARIAFGMASLLAALLLPGYALLGWMIWASRGEQPSPATIAMAFELALPLSAGLLASHLMSIEREEGFDAIRRTLPERSWNVPLARALGAVVLTVAVAALTALLFRLASGGSSPTADMLVAALPPVILLIGLGLLLNNVSGSYWVSAVAVIGYWFLDYQTHGQYTGILYLFRATMPIEVDYNVNRCVLAGAGICLMILNALYSGWRRTRGG